MCCGDGKALYLSLSGKCIETSKASQHTEGQTRAGPAPIKLHIIPTHRAEQSRVTEIPRERLVLVYMPSVMSQYENLLFSEIIIHKRDA